MTKNLTVYEALDLALASINSGKKGFIRSSVWPDDYWFEIRQLDNGHIQGFPNIMPGEKRVAPWTEYISLDDISRKDWMFMEI